MKKCPFEDNVYLSIGEIKKMRMNKAGMVKYEIAYKDENGHEHTNWSNWMRYDGYSVGDSIPMKSLAIPGTFGRINMPMAVDSHPQRRAEPYIAAIVVAGIGSMIAGYCIGKSQQK